MCLRQPQPRCDWSKGIWFPHSTPKYSFLVWVAIKKRLQTSDKIRQWNSTLDGVCVLCQEMQETCQHLFFSCRYSRRIWRDMVGGIMRERFTAEWSEIFDVILHSGIRIRGAFLFVMLFKHWFVVYGGSEMLVDMENIRWVWKFCQNL